MTQSMNTEKINKLAILECQYANLWYLANSTRNEKIAAACRIAQEAMNDYAASADMSDIVMNKSITGVDENENVSHYDIDLALEKKFGKKVMCDSESGMFSADTNKSNLADVLSFLAQKFPGLKTDVNDSEPKLFVNWNAAIKYAEDNNLVVPKTEIEIWAEEKVKSIQDKIATKKLEIEALEKELTAI